MLETVDEDIFDGQIGKRRSSENDGRVMWKIHKQEKEWLFNREVWMGRKERVGKKIMYRVVEELGAGSREEALRTPKESSSLFLLGISITVALLNPLVCVIYTHIFYHFA